VAVAILRITGGNAPGLECEGSRPLEARQSRSRAVRNRMETEAASGLAADEQSGDPPLIDERTAETAAILQLIDELIGDELHRAVDQDEIVRCRTLVPFLELAFGDADPKLLRGGGQKADEDSTPTASMPITARTATA